MNRFLLSAVSVVCMLSATAQERKGTATVQLVNEQSAPLPNATVELLRSKDSVLVKAAVSDAGGKTDFDHLAPGSYLIRTSITGYTTAYTAAFTIAEDVAISLPAISMKAAPSARMQGVTITAKRPFIQKLSDRIVVNVENSIVNAGSTAMEVLERSPGVNIDQNDVLSLRGRSGVIIMIDGKPTPLSGSDLAAYLRGLPSGAIDRIDIITNPSSKYDAAGSSGIIDIRMKKDQRLGTNGTLTASYGQGVYPKAGAGGTFNYRNQKVNVFGNYNYAYRLNLNNLILNRNFYNNGVFTGADDKNNYIKSPLGINTARAGADFFPSKNTIIGFVVNSSFIHFTRDGRNTSTVMDRSKQPSYNFNTYTTNNDHYNNTVGNINLKHNFSGGKELTADLDYGTYTSNSLSTTNTRYRRLDGTPLQPDYRLNGDQDGKLTLKTGKADYINPLANGAKWEAGVKTSFVSSDNDARFFDVSSGTPQNDVAKTNHFYYKENNNAAYINFSKAYKKWDFQVGLRGEQTHITTHQVRGNVDYDSSYFKLFPTAFLNYKLKEEQTLGVSLSRRINRPGYQSLNPFLYLIDVTTYGTGNPGLRPEVTVSYELNYTVKSMNFTLGYSHTKDNNNIAIARFKDVFPTIPSADNVTVQIPVNLASSDYVGLSASVPVRITKWWNMINNANVYYNHFNGSLGGVALDNGSPAGDISSNNSFSFKKGWSAELNGSFNSGGRSGFMVGRPQWALSTGVQKAVLKNKGTVRLNMSDIFWTNYPGGTITYPGRYVEHWHAYRESRVATLSFTYRFGSNKVAAARRRTTASEEERQRAGN